MTQGQCKIKRVWKRRVKVAIQKKVQKGKVIASLSDEGCKLVKGLHKGFIGNTVVTIEHPTGIKFEVATPNMDTKFQPWMIEYEIYCVFR